MKITTIIPTLCEASRRQQLLRAIESIKAASISSVRILVVVNGQRFDSELLASLRARTDLEVVQVEQGSQTHAQLVGRRAVNTEFFSFLDDDDEYLPGALDLRLLQLEMSPAASLIVTNGFVSVAAKEVDLYSRTAHVSANPFAELFRENWLHNCNHLFRTADVGTAYFENAPSILEWTWLAFRLCMDGKSVASSTAKTFRYNDTPGSLSKSSFFLASRVELYDKMLSAGPPKTIARIIRQRTSSAWHEMATLELGMGLRSKAVGAHLRSMACHWSGLKYMPFSRQLLRRRLPRIR